MTIPSDAYLTAAQLTFFPALEAQGYAAGVSRGPTIPEPLITDDWWSYWTRIINVMYMYDGVADGNPIEFAIGFNSAIENGASYVYLHSPTGSLAPAPAKVG
jgi:hypothetical protein